MSTPFLDFLNIDNVVTKKTLLSIKPTYLEKLLFSYLLKTLQGKIFDFDVECSSEKCKFTIKLIKVERTILFTINDSTEKIMIDNHVFYRTEDSFENSWAILEKELAYFITTFE